MRAPAWLTTHPIAHRGLHDASRGIIENTPSAVTAAVAAGFAIEVDLQLTADEEVVVYHDDTIDRLNEGSGAVRSMTASALKSAPFKSTSDRVMTLGELFELVVGRSTLVLELKSAFDGDDRLARRAVAQMAAYPGPAAAMSFDPVVVAAVRQLDPRIIRGVVAERYYDQPAWNPLPVAARRNMAYFLHHPHTRPHFIAYAVKDLPATLPWLARTLLGVPLLTWTVRTVEDRKRAARWADQMIFEGFRP